MQRESKSLSAVCALSVAVAIGCVASAAASAKNVVVVRCHTTTATSEPLSASPARLEVRGAPRGAVAYTNSEQFLIGHGSMHCSGAIGADGSSVLEAWPFGAPKPGFRTHGPGMTLSVVPACVGCKAELVCPFFPKYAASLRFPCRTGVPPGEQVQKPRPRLALFRDPPGVDGDGWPSGGPDAADGVTGFTRAPYGGIAFAATCTLPRREHRFCTASLNDVIRRYG